MPHERLTCLVPTHNRPLFLRRFLGFYARFRPEFSFLIVDSSCPVAAAENRSVIDHIRSELNIRYEHSDLPFYEKIAANFDRVTSPFVVLCADDDYLLPEAVSRCVDFLEVEQGYATAMGHKALLNTTKNRWTGRLKVLKGYSIEYDRPLDRCRHMATQWMSNFYAVNRTEALYRDFQIVSVMSNSKSLSQIPEMLMSQLSVIRGRAKVLPMMYSVWQRHATNCTNTVAKSIQPLAEQFYKEFNECLSSQLSQVGIDRVDAARYVDDWHGSFRYPDFTRRRQLRSTGEHVVRVLRGIAERAADFIWTDRVRHCRSVQSRDLVGCETTWHAAVQLMRDFPHGIPADQAVLKRSA